MGRYTRTYKTTLEFDGDSVEVELGRLSREDVDKMLPFAQAASAGDDGKVKMTREALDEVIRLVRKYAKRIDVKDAEGEIVPVDELLNVAYFLPLVGAVAMHLVVASTPGDAEGKYLGAPSADLLQGSAPDAEAKVN